MLALLMRPPPLALEPAREEAGELDDGYQALETSGVERDHGG